MKKRFFALLTAVCIALTTGLTTGLTALADGGENSDMTIGMSTQEQCSCTTLCTEGNINPDCPVCGAEGADLTACKGAPLMMRAAPLATDGIELYVGGQKITESGCYENKSGTWTKVDGTEPANGQFSYDADSVTLTLNRAKIVNYQNVTVGGGFTYPGSVIAFSQSADVSLTIVVSQGTSNITGTGGIRVVSKAGDASLSISGPGSLEVNVDRNDSGITLIGSKNVNLNIDGADVKTLAAYYYGVDLHAGDGFKAAAVVNNGKLTAGGSGGIGIYYRWTNPSDSGTSSLTVSGNAVVDTRDSKILISSEASEVQVGAGSDGNGGIVFNGKNGTVYGDVTLQEDLKIGTDETLTIPDGSSLNTNGNLTNNGTIINKGTLTGDVGGSGTVTPKITTDSLPNGTVDTEYKQTLIADGTAPITWKVTGGDLPDGLSLSEDGVLSGTPTAETAEKDFTFTVTATNDAGSDSKEFTLTIGVAPVYSITADPLKLDFGTLTEGYTPASQTVTITNNGNQELTLTQPASTEHFEVGNLSKTELAVGEEVTFTVQPKAGLAAGTYSENIDVTASNNATATISASLTVQKASVPTKPEVPSTGTTSGGSTGESTYPDVEDAQTSYEQATRNFWNRTINKIKKADEGDSLRIYIGIHEEIPGDVIQAIRENGVNVTFYNQDGDEVTVYAESAPTKYQAVWTLKQLGNYVLTEQQTPAAQEESPADQQPADEPTTPTQPAETEAVDTAKPNPSTGEGSGAVIAMIAAAAALAGLGATLRKR